MKEKKWKKMSHQKKLQYAHKNWDKLSEDQKKEIKQLQIYKEYIYSGCELYSYSYN